MLLFATKKCSYVTICRLIFLAAWNGMAVEERGSIENPRVRLCQPDDSIQLEISTRVHTTVYICYFRE